MPEANPRTHRCTIGTISYELATDGTIWCRDCGRIWDRTEWGWQPDPKPEPTAAQRQKFANKGTFKKGARR